MEQKFVELRDILKSEIKPALGCTGPTCISYVVAVARDMVGGNPKHVKLVMDRTNGAKNCDVGIPGTTFLGVNIAAALGALCADASAGLENLHNVTPTDEVDAARFAKENVDVEIDWQHERVGLYVDATVETDNGVGRAIISQTHLNVVYKERNGETVFGTQVLKRDDSEDETAAPIRKYLLRDFLEFAENVPFEEIAFLQDAVDMNTLLAETGISERLGVGFGYAFSNLTNDTLISYAKALTAAASDARMCGKDMPAMSCATSGNVGITASLPLVAVAKIKNIKSEKLLRALALSYLLTIFGKNHIGRLSAMCACAVTASVGVAAGTVLLLDGTYDQIDHAIMNTIASVFGIVCDGARVTCAYKLANAVGIAIESALFAIAGVNVPTGQGVISRNADETIAMMGRFAREGMVDMDKALCKVMFERSQDAIE